MVVFPQKKMKLVINNQIVVEAEDIVQRGLLTTLINAINEEPQPAPNLFVTQTCEELSLPYEEYDEVDVVGTRPQSIRH